MHRTLKPCTTCGKVWTLESELIDTVYPSRRDNTTGEFCQWTVVCQLHNTGCGRAVYGVTKEDAVECWNRGKTHETSRF
jgi:hypothetical protein